MAIRYFYIDDDPIPTITEIARGLSVNEEKLLVIPHQHKKWESILDFIIEHQNEFDGLLFDWNLSNKNEEGETANFNMEALAQQIRRNIIEKKGFQKDFPILLCSANYKFSRIFKKELTSHDLFDNIYEKDEFNDKSDLVRRELMSLANGYKFISKKLNKGAPLSSFKEILATNELIDVDYRIEEYLKRLIQEGKPAHEIARFILGKLVKSNGLLIDKYLLASRFGVDIFEMDKLMTDDWEILKKKIFNCKYRGAFHDYSENWWMAGISEWWFSIFKLPLGSLEGSKRVKLLNEKFNLSLKTAIRTDKSKSNYFWVTCQKTLKPLAIEDSVLLPPDLNQSPWEEDKYISIDMALEGDAKSIHPLERERVKQLKKIYKKTRQK